MSDFVRMTIAVPKEAYDRLRESARREMRQPRQQAHWLLYQALGMIPDEKPHDAAHCVRAKQEQGKQPQA